MVNLALLALCLSGSYVPGHFTLRLPCVGLRAEVEKRRNNSKQFLIFVKAQVLQEDSENAFSKSVHR